MRLKTTGAKKLISARDGISTVTRPDVVSNIRIIRYHARTSPHQSLLRSQIEARRLRATQKWHEFWTHHNAEYNSQLQALQARFEGRGEVPCDEMSRFYRARMLATKGSHADFNRWWIKENFGLLYASCKCWFWERLPLRKEPGFFGGH